MAIRWTDAEEDRAAVRRLSHMLTRRRAAHRAEKPVTAALPPAVEPCEFERGKYRCDGRNGPAWFIVGEETACAAHLSYMAMILAREHGQAIVTLNPKFTTKEE